MWLNKNSVNMSSVWNGWWMNKFSNESLSSSLFMNFPMSLRWSFVLVINRFHWNFCIQKPTSFIVFLRTDRIFVTNSSFLFRCPHSTTTKTTRKCFLVFSNFLLLKFVVGFKHSDEFFLVKRKNQQNTKVKGKSG